MGRLKKSKSNASVHATPGPAGGSGGSIEIVFTFDTTGSMNSCLTEVRKKLDDIIQRLFSDIPNLRIAVFAHGDYGDTYVTKYVDFTNDVTKLCDFVNKVGSTGGGDWEECYELVLKQTRELLSWSPGTQRSVVMIGDAIPHPVGCSRNKGNIDWKDEADRLRDEIGARVYAVQACDNAAANFFWEGLAKLTFGKHLKLGEFDTIVDMMMAICYREHGPDLFEAYEREVRAREGAAIRKELDLMFNTLRDDDTATTSISTIKKPAKITKLTAVRVPAKRKAPLASTAGRVAKRPKKTMAARKKYKRVYKNTKLDNRKSGDDTLYSIGRQHRETVFAKNFMFNDLDWTKWQLAISNQPEDIGKMWTPRRDRGYSVRNFKTNIMKETFTPAVYEFAVKPKDGHRMYPVCVRAHLGGSRKQHSWETSAVRNRYVRERILYFTKTGGKIFIRKTLLDKPISCNSRDVNNVRELEKLIHDTYDYAWNKQNKSWRQFNRNGVSI